MPLPNLSEIQKKFAELLTSELVRSVNVVFFIEPDSLQQFLAFVHFFNTLQAKPKHKLAITVVIDTVAPAPACSAQIISFCRQHNINMLINKLPDKWRLFGHDGLKNTDELKRAVSEAHCIVTLSNWISFYKLWCDDPLIFSNSLLHLSHCSASSDLELVRRVLIQNAELVFRNLDGIVEIYTELDKVSPLFFIDDWFFSLFEGTKLTQMLADQLRKVTEKGWPSFFTLIQSFAGAGSSAAIASPFDVYYKHHQLKLQQLAEELVSYINCLPDVVAGFLMRFVPKMQQVDHLDAACLLSLAADKKFGQSFCQEFAQYIGQVSKTAVSQIAEAFALHLAALECPGGAIVSTKAQLLVRHRFAGIHAEQFQREQLLLSSPPSIENNQLVAVTVLLEMLGMAPPIILLVLKAVSVADLPSRTATSDTKSTVDSEFSSLFPAKEMRKILSPAEQEVLGRRVLNVLTAAHVRIIINTHAPSLLSSQSSPLLFREGQRLFPGHAWNDETDDRDAEDFRRQGEAEPPSAAPSPHSFNFWS